MSAEVYNLVFTLSLFFVQLEIKTVVAVFQRVIYYPLALEITSLRCHPCDSDTIAT